MPSPMPMYSIIIIIIIMIMIIIIIIMPHQMQECRTCEKVKETRTKALFSKFCH